MEFAVNSFSFLLKRFHLLVLLVPPTFNSLWTDVRITLELTAAFVDSSNRKMERVGKMPHGFCTMLLQIEMKSRLITYLNKVR